jgi:bifunctional UDP-N-acetylglucosamine pyrophosphorylase/glucosamine-1-phosphate N-acetyltransferase
MILCGDTPLLKAQTLREMFDHHLSTNATITLMTTVLEDPTNYGRIVCDAADKICEIVEQKDCHHEQLSLQEINGGIYCVNTNFLFDALNRVGTNNSQGEVYLTDIVKIAVTGGQRVERYRASTPIDILGVNSRIELAAAQKELSMRRNIHLMDQGVTMYFPESITICPHSAIGIDSILHPGVTISNNSTIGESCVISQGTIVDNCIIGDNVTIEPYCHLVNTEISKGTDVKYTDNQR